MPDPALSLCMNLYCPENLRDGWRVLVAETDGRETMARVAIVTGGTRGIGEAISIMLRDKGMTVAANYGGNDERAAAFTRATGIASYRWDVGDHAACLEGCARVAADIGPIDVVVNNAGVTRDGVLAKMSFDDWNEVMRINLGGCFNMAKATFAGMRERGWGRIVHTRSG